MADDREESLAWDRVGRFLQESGTKSSEMADRNLRLWSSISSHLKEENYTADHMANDVARSMTTAMNNLSDMWSMLTREPRLSQVAQTLPTAFLLFDWTGPVDGHRLLEPVRIEVDYDREKRSLPPRAKIALSGTRTPAGKLERERAESAGKAIATSEDGVAKLLDCVIACHEGPAPVYVLETLNYQIASGAAKAELGVDKGLIPGVYEGMVYLIDPTMALASLRILVEGEPPESSPEVSEQG